MPYDTRPRDPLKEATIIALKRMVDPLLSFMFDAGVTVHEFSQLVRERSVRVAAKRVIADSGRNSKSRVAIITGLPRSEVARILNSDDVILHSHSGQHPARKVLGAWYDNPRFVEANGDPAVLPIFGRRRSFEQLVALHGGGIPVRAMLDELTQMDAVERLSDQRVRAKSRFPILTGVTTSAITSVGERTSDLLGTLRSNLRRTSKPLFEGTAVVGDADLDVISLLRREISEQGLSFINSANSILSRSRAKSKHSNSKLSTKCRVGVTVYYFQDQIPGVEGTPIETVSRRRKNLQRRRAPLKRMRKSSEFRRNTTNS